MLRVNRKLLFSSLFLINFVHAGAFIYDDDKVLPNEIMGELGLNATSVTKGNIYGLSSDNKLIKCDIYGLNCTTIDSFPKSTPKSLSFNDDGDGVIGVEEKNGLAIYRQDKFIGYAAETFHDGVKSVSLTSTGIYVLNGDKELWKCNINGVDCIRLDYFKYTTPVSISFNNDGDGVIGVSEDNGLAIYQQDNFIGYAAEHFHKGVISVSLTSNGIYVLNNKFYELWKCKTNGNECVKLDYFKYNIPVGISFNNDMNGAAAISKNNTPALQKL